MEKAKIVSTTGSSIESYLDWIRNELEKKNYGEVNISFVITRGQVTSVKKTSIDIDQTPLKPINKV